MIDEQVKKDCLTEQYITKDLEKELQNAIEQERLYLQGKLLLSEINKLLNDSQYPLTEQQKARLEKSVAGEPLDDIEITAQLEKQLECKYETVKKYILTSHPEFTDDVIDQVRQKQDWIKKMQLHVAHRKVLMNKKISDYVQVVLEILGVTWHIIQEFKYKLGENEGPALDNYYSALSQTLLLKIKILHVSVLIGTYDKEFIYALVTLREMLEARLNTSQKQLHGTSRQLQEYNDMEPEFHTLSQAYNDLLYKIESTKQDIDRITTTD